MPYVGGSLAPLFKPEPSRLAVRDACDHAGDLAHTLVARNTPVHTGNLRTSWYKTPANRTRVGGLEAGYRCEVATDVDYAPYVEWDTRPHEIRARPGGALRFQVGGEWVFAKRVNHPGTRGHHMMAIAAHLTEMALPGILRTVAEEWARRQVATRV